jgi:hypothetical protein
VKIKVNILHSNLKVNGNELAFLFPLKFNSKKLRDDFGITISYFQGITNSLFECDVLIVSSWIIGREYKWWQGSTDKIYDFLETSKSKVKKVIWSDISDSTGTTHFLVLPYVDKYLKCQILSDKTQYLKKEYANRVFTGYYHKEFNILDNDSGESHLGIAPLKKDLEKIKVGWNTGMANYSCYSSYWSILGHYLNGIDLPLFYPTRWVSPNSQRAIDYSCRVGYSYERNTVAYQRKEIASLLQDKISVEKLKRKDYFSEMENSKICISPFGLGEITLRDFEIIISGSAIFKANVDHMETWPNLFVKDETYIDYNWNLSDFEEKLEYYSSKPELIIEIAKNSQDIYKNLLTTRSGHFQFCDRFSELIK